MEKHTPSAQTDYLRREMADGKQLFILIDEYPVGIVSVKDDLTENLYVLPSEQRRGYGTQLLEFAISQCTALSINHLLTPICYSIQLTVETV